MALTGFIAALHEHRDSLADQIAFLEAGNQVRMHGEEPEASTAKFLATLQRLIAGLDELIPECEAMRVEHAP